MSKNKFPAGWDAEKVKSVIDHYEMQSEDEEVAEDEKYLKNKSTIMVIPKVLIPQVRAMIAKHDQELSHK